MTAVAYAGGAAAHSAAAAERLFPADDHELVALDTFAEVVRAAVEGDVRFGVLPIESSLAGPVAETHDLLYDSPLSIVAETSIPIRHHLVARGLEVIASDVGDHPEAFTRFVSVATHTRLDGIQETWRTAFSFVTDHRAGALHDAIEPFARHGIDLVQLVSRPIPHSPFTYRFDAVLAGHPLDPVTRAALTEVRGRVRRLRVFGSYPAGT